MRISVLCFADDDDSRRTATLPKTAPPFSMVAWCHARRFLLSFAVMRGRGLLNLDNRVVKVTVASLFLTSPESHASYLQRLVAYFWVQVRTLLFLLLL
jgi:hypothetical protein